MIYFYVVILILLVIPLGILVGYLWKHRQENGPTQILRWIILIGAFLKLLYFLVEIGVMARIIIRNGHPVLLIILPRIITGFLLMVFNWWALFKIKKLK